MRTDDHRGLLRIVSFLDYACKGPATGEPDDLEFLKKYVEENFGVCDYEQNDQ